MKRIITAAALAAAFAGATPALAFADATYHVRNASQSLLLCSLRRERGSIAVRFQLHPGREFRETRETFGRPRKLTCAVSPRLRAIFRIRAGLTYELREAGNGELRIRTVTAQGGTE